MSDSNPVPPNPPAASQTPEATNLSLTPPAPQPLLTTPDTETPRDSGLFSTKESTTGGSGAQLNENPGDELPAAEKEAPKRKRWLWILGGLILLAIVVVAVIVPVYFTVIKPKEDGSVSSAASSGGDDTSNDEPNDESDSSEPGALSGGDGSQITDENGNTFTYTNPFGGFWVYDPSNPFNNSARPNSWTPPLDTPWDWETNRVFGVNAGGWLVIEPFISPALFEKYPEATDEWTLSEAMRADEAGGGIGQIEEHYKTFITEQDFARMAGAGLNWVRIPFPFWAVEIYPDEPFVGNLAWTYLLKAVGWARKYGLRVNLDLHSVPGSQNGYNHSGRFGEINFLVGPMGYVNAQRTLEYIRVVTEFFSRPEYQDVVQMFSILNEAYLATIGMESMTHFYHEAYDMVRGITGVGAGNGPYIAIHDGFQPLELWENYLPGADRLVMDIHPYFAFSGSAALEPIGVDGRGGDWPTRGCTTWGSYLNSSRRDFGVSIGGEFSAGYNDCGKFLRGAQETENDYGGDCSFWEDARLWNQTTLDGIRTFAMAGMDAIHDWFFWTWKIGDSSVSGVPSSPLWSYSHGLDMGYIPADPREAVGLCESLGVSDPFVLPYEPSQTGGGDGVILETHAWPPPSMVDAPPPFASYTATGSILSLPEPTFSGTTLAATVWEGTASAPTPISGCTYPDAYRPEAGFVWACAVAEAPVPRAPEPTSPPLRFRRTA